MKIKGLFLGLMMASTFSFAQVQIDSTLIVKDSVKISNEVLMEKSPIKASLYSAILPGAGQLYNKKWWKAPIALGLVGTGTGFTIYYNNLYKKYRKAYIAVREGTPNEFSGILTPEQLAVIQDDYKRKRDYSVALTALAYLLNVVDATVDAHLFTVRNDTEMSFKPTVIQDEMTLEPVLGLAFNLKF
ncbi:DUF5683 domain-containing protein [Empedobacter stercoris]|uniref:DUF5683 domain-containing protein n=2 Tax=Empedobacter TaxID=59734 RepID=A0ABY8V7W8_9FLAO|nr:MULTISPECIES: DUF5683 domain-containing protein [Empedobacter]MCA4777871.1 hypothetical protein [Empedobacter stercoris]MCA4810388.1 hypothetical protein [Empedobacter stercoris]MDM1524210.1 hypothetical protein [Empedobacter sp. 225-1]MDM1544132.1 hypothetical protein [Empedobacter sp. 189-2]NOJ76304.1 hypothetical protein [Empedobacter stercoris]